MDGLEAPENAVMVQGQFESIVRLADEVMETSETRDAGVALLRAAFKLCPACPLPFQGEELLLAHSALPADTTLRTRTTQVKRAMRSSTWTRLSTGRCSRNRSSRRCMI